MEIFHFHEINWGGSCQIIGRIHPPIPPKLAPMLIEFPKNIGKSRDKSYSTDQKTSSIVVPTILQFLPLNPNPVKLRESGAIKSKPLDISDE